MYFVWMKKILNFEFFNSKLSALDRFNSKLFFLNKFSSKLFALKRFSSKGFIGAIGDDLPSLIPIVVSLLLFFSIFAITLNSYNSKNLEIRQELSLLSISRGMKGESILLSVDQFLDRCESVKLKKYEYNFMIAVYSSESDVFLDPNFDPIVDFQNSSLDDPSENFLTKKDFEDEEQSFFCYYKKVGGTEFSRKINYITRAYPLAVQITQKINGEDYELISPSIMYMVVWR